MKATPFERVKIGQVFRDIDGTLIMRINKAYGDNEARSLINCVILISNKTEVSRGGLLAKTRDIYCEVLDDRELSDLGLIDITETKEIPEI